MLYQPELMVYVWLLPVTCFVALPGLFATCRVSIGIMKNSAVPVREHKKLEQEQDLEIKALA